MGSRTLELAQEVHSRAAEAKRLQEEFAAAQAAGGHGVYREPSAVLRELGEALTDVRDAAREAEDDAERDQRWL